MFQKQSPFASRLSSTQGLGRLVGMEGKPLPMLSSWNGPMESAKTHGSSIVKGTIMMVLNIAVNFLRDFSGLTPKLVFLSGYSSKAAEI